MIVVRLFSWSEFTHLKSCRCVKPAGQRRVWAIAAWCWQLVLKARSLAIVLTAPSAGPFLADIVNFLLKLWPAFTNTCLIISQSPIQPQWSNMAGLWPSVCDNQFGRLIVILMAFNYSRYTGTFIIKIKSASGHTGFFLQLKLPYLSCHITE